MQKLPLYVVCKQRFTDDWQLQAGNPTEVTKSIVKGIGIGFLSCIGIGIGIAKTIFQVLVIGIGIVKMTSQVLVLVLVLLKSSSSIGQNTPS